MLNYIKNLFNKNKIEELEKRIDNLPKIYTHEEIVDLINSKKAIVDPDPYHNFQSKYLEIISDKIGDLGFDLRNQFDKRIDNLDILTKDDVSKIVNSYLNLHIESLSLDKKTLICGQSTKLTVCLNLPAPSGGCNIYLGSNKNDVRLPKNVFVKEGSKSCTIDVGTSNVVHPITIVITAMVGGITKSISLLIKPITLEDIDVNPKSLKSGENIDLTLTLNSSSLPNGTYVWYNSSPAGIGNTLLHIPEGKTKHTSTIKTAGVAVTTQITLNATLNGITKSTNFTLYPNV